MADIDFTKLKYSQLQKLTKELDPLLYYHGVRHTQHEVLPATQIIGSGENVSNDDMLLLLTAALFHDAGYLIRYENNETIATEMTREILPDHGFSWNQIDTINELILATRMPQQPNNLLEKVICDADLSTLGRGDFFISSMKLWREICSFRKHIDLNTWLHRQHNFLFQHNYFTLTAHKLFSPNKKANLKELTTTHDNKPISFTLSHNNQAIHKTSVNPIMEKLP